MICLRSGYCCVHLDVMIVDNPTKGISEDNIVHKPSGVKCKHLKFNGTKAECSIHDEEWYNETPCYEYTQIEVENSNCRLGEYWIKQKENIF